VRAGGVLVLLLARDSQRPLVPLGLLAVM
jgi:hypothetical protein